FIFGLMSTGFLIDSLLNGKILGIDNIVKNDKSNKYEYNLYNLCKYYGNNKLLPDTKFRECSNQIKWNRFHYGCEVSVIYLHTTWNIYTLYISFLSILFVLYHKKDWKLVYKRLLSAEHNTNNLNYLNQNKLFTKIPYNKNYKIY